MIKGVIYDMDGLMVDSEPISKEANEILFARYGRRFSDVPEEIRKDSIGRRILDFLGRYSEALGLKVPLETLLKERGDIFLGLVRDKLEAMPGLVDSLSLFRGNGFKTALASSATSRYIDIVLDKFKINEYFDVIVSGDSVGIGKPHPETYLVASNKLGLEPAGCLVLEDATNGIESAKAAGCKCIAVYNPHIPAQDYSKADHFVKSLKDVTLETVNSLS